MRAAGMALTFVFMAAAAAGGCGRAKSPRPGFIPGRVIVPQAEPAEVPAAPEQGTGQSQAPQGQQDLSGLKVAIVIAPTGFRDEEFLEPYQALKDAGAEVTVVSVKKGECTGAVSAKAEATATPDEISVEDYAGVVFVGGPGMYKLLDNGKFIALAQKFGEKQDKIIAAICVSPAVLANAGLLKGVRATAWKDVRPILAAKGAEVIQDEPVVVSGRFITASGPDAAKAYARAIVAALSATRTEQGQK